MEIKIHTIENTVFAELTNSETIINNVQDALDLMANANYQGAERIIIREHHLLPDFFNLKTRIAGEILERFSIYRNKLAIVGNFSNYKSNSLRDFIYESNKFRQTVFVETFQEAVNKLS